MKRLPSALFSLFAALFVASASLSTRAEERPAWGWRADDGLGYWPKPPRAAKGDRTDGWHAALTAPAAEASETAPKPKPQAKPDSDVEVSPAVKSYCENIADAALDARFLSQKAELTRLEEELAKKTAILEAKRAEFQEWLKRRDEFISRAEGNLVKLYAKIKPDAAAPQLAAMDEEAAAALLLKLNPKTSSAILDQMEAGKAARLVSVMIGAATPSEKGPPERSGGRSDQPGDVRKGAAEPQNSGRRS